MIAYVEGRLSYIEAVSQAAVVEAGGIGFRIFMPAGDLGLLPDAGSDVRIYTYLQVRDDAFVLYGFLTREDRKLFEKLLSVGGIGPKAALGILSALDPDDFKLAVLGDDAKAIAAAPGVGIKTAKKIILELKDKIDPEEIFGGVDAGNGDGADTGALGKTASRTKHGLGDAGNEAIEALVALGYGSAEAVRAVRSAAPKDDAEVEDILRAALKYIG